MHRTLTHFMISILTVLQEGNLQKSTLRFRVVTQQVNGRIRLQTQSLVSDSFPL